MVDLEVVLVEAMVEAMGEAMGEVMGEVMVDTVEVMDTIKCTFFVVIIKKKTTIRYQVFVEKVRATIIILSYLT